MVLLPGKLVYTVSVAKLAKVVMGFNGLIYVSLVLCHHGVTDLSNINCYTYLVVGTFLGLGNMTMEKIKSLPP